MIENKGKHEEKEKAISIENGCIDIFKTKNWKEREKSIALFYSLILSLSAKIFKRKRAEED